MATEHDDADLEGLIGRAGIGRSLNRAKDIVRLKEAEELAKEGVSKGFIMALTGVADRLAKRLLDAHEVARKPGRRKQNLVDVFERANRHLEGTVFGSMFVMLAPTVQADQHSVSPRALLDSYRLYLRLTLNPTLDCDTCYLIARGLATRELQLVRCRVDNTEFLASTVDIQVNQKYTRGECPACRLRAARSSTAAKPAPETSDAEPVLATTPK